MFDTRYSALTFNKLAGEIGVRVICVDRPGLGGATPVNIEQRIDVWLEAVPAILARLGVKHVSLLSHSAGTLDSLNMLSRLRHILDPKVPYAAFLAPWVHNDHSNVALTKIIANLPTGAFSYWSGLSKFVNQSIMPVSGWSGGVISSVSGLFSEQTGTINDSEAAAQEKYGVSKAVEDQIDTLQGKYVFTEGMSDANDEALLCGKKVGGWGACEDYMKFIEQLCLDERARRSEGKLRVRLHFAASDVMIGEGGRKYFEKCWNQDGVAEVVDVRSRVWPETNHDSVSLEFRKGAIRPIFEEIRRLHDEARARGT